MVVHMKRTPPARAASTATEALPFAVVPIAGKGKGCIALRQIELGERILTEAPLIMLSEGMAEAALTDAIDALSASDRSRLFDLSVNMERFGPEKTAFGIVTTNGIPFRQHGRRHGGVFAIACRFNHACDSNALYKWNAANGRLTVHATRRIEVGSEITFNYGYDSIFCPRDARQRRLRETFGFVCTCNHCALTGSALRESDERLERRRAFPARTRRLRGSWSARADGSSSRDGSRG